MSLECVMHERAYVPGENFVNTHKCCENAKWCVVYYDDSFDTVCDRHLPVADPKFVVKEIGEA